MSKYAVIKVGSSQERVTIGDEFSVSSSFEEKTVIPVLVSPRTVSYTHLTLPTN